MKSNKQIKAMMESVVAKRVGITEAWDKFDGTHGVLTATPGANFMYEANGTVSIDANGHPIAVCK